MKRIKLSVGESEFNRLIAMTKKAELPIEGVIGQALRIYEAVIDVVDKGGSAFVELDGKRTPIIEKTTSK